MRRLALLAGSLTLLMAIGLAGSALAAVPTFSVSFAPASPVEATSSGGAEVAYSWSSPDTPQPTVTCNVSGDPWSPATARLFPIGDTAVTCTATNPDTLEQTTQNLDVIVQDTTPPAFGGVPGPLVFEATSHEGVELAYSLPVAIDLVDGSRPVSCSPAPGGFFPVRETTVNCTSSDSRGNSSSASFTVSVRDTTPPVFQDKPPGAVKRVKGDQSAKVVYAAPVATDTVDGDIKSVCKPPSGSVFKFGATTVACTATDSHGNQSKVTFQVRVAKIGPDLLAPADGIHLALPPLLLWTAVKHATYYNIQLYKKGHKILSRWPRSNHLQVKRSWTYGGKKYSLTAGTYTWYVWPGFGELASAKYGGLIGQRSFTIS